LKEKWAKGDTIRGQLHKESFLGAIKLVKKDKDGKWLKNDDKTFQFEDIKYVVRKELIYKKNDQSPGFKNLKEIEDTIVDKSLFEKIKKQVESIGDFKDAINSGIWMLNKDGEKVNRIRHVRCFKVPKGVIEIKAHSHLSKHDYKKYVIAENAETPYYGLYENAQGKYEHECLTLWRVSELNCNLEINKIEELFPIKENYSLKVLSKGQKIMILKDKNENYSELSDSDLNKRLYNIIKFYKKEGYIQAQFHLDSRDNNTLKKDFPKDGFDNSEQKWGERGINGFSIPNFETPVHRLLLSKKNFCFLIEGKNNDFVINRDGKIKWNKT
jgi:CRISPR-associated endonuclease Csn1